MVHQDGVAQVYGNATENSRHVSWKPTFIMFMYRPIAHSYIIYFVELQDVDWATSATC